MSATLLYSDYGTNYRDDWKADFEVNAAFSNDFYDDSALFHMFCSVSGVVKKILHETHNNTACSLQLPKSFECLILDGCTIAAVEVGLLATAFILSPAETIIRAVIAAVILPFTSITALFFEETPDFCKNLAVIATGGLVHTALAIPETLVSALYSHLTYYASEIDYVGHGACLVLCEEPNVKLDTF